MPMMAASKHLTFDSSSLGRCSNAGMVALPSRGVYSRTVTTTYDALNRPSTITENGRVTTYGYDLAGRAISLEQANGLVTKNLYDALGRLKQRKLYNTNNQQTETLALFNWNHDALGNVKYQGESWPGDANRTAGWRRTKMEYDAGNRLFTEEVTEAGPEGNPAPSRLTTYLYDAAHNRTSKTEVGGAQPDKTTTYVYNEDNQLTSWTEVKDNQTRTASLTYDDNGNRSSQTVSSGGNTEATAYTWDSFNRLTGVTLPSSDAYQYRYDFRTRRITTGQTGGDHTAIVFAGGLSVAEYEVANLTAAVSNPTSPAVQYQRGPDMGGGVGGLLYSLKDGGSKFNLSNGRGDVVAQSDTTGELSWTASYEAGGKRTLETGQNTDKQRANTKDEDPTGLLNEGFRYRDLETGVWLSRDPAGFVDGPNLYAYVLQNPWSKWDPHGLSAVKKGRKLVDTVKKVNGHYPINAKFAEKGKGTFDDLSDSTKKRYAHLEGVEVKWKKTGYPDFSDHARSINGQSNFEVEGLTGKMGRDTKLLREKLGLSVSEMNTYLDGYTLHHVEDGKTLQLVRSDIHDAFRHTGGRANLSEQIGEIISPRLTNVLVEGGGLTAAMRAGAEDFGESTAAGAIVSTVFTKENAAAFDNAFSETILPGSSEGIDHSYNSTYDVNWKKMWQSFVNFMTTNDQ